MLTITTGTGSSMGAGLRWIFIRLSFGNAWGRHPDLVVGSPSR